MESAVAHGLAGADSSDQAAMRVAESLGVHMGWPVVELWLVDDDRQMLTCQARFVAAGRDVPDFAVDELEYDTGLPGKVYRERRPVWVPDLAAGRLARSDAAARYGLHVAVAVPIRSGDHVLGVLAVYGNAVEDAEEALVGLLGGLAAHVGQFLERRRAEELTVELARTKDEFVTMVTHELRNPVATIASAAELLEGELDAESAERLRPYLAMIARSAERLGAMAGDLLDLAGLESGQPTVHRQHTDLGQILREVVDAMLPAASDKGLTLTADLAGGLGLYADPQRLRQVADNLLSNAVKYTPAGGRIAVTAWPGPDETVEWSVSDTGIGIPAADRPRLFRRFYRASTAVDRRIPGTGLGLVVARAIVERHQGSIAVAERDGPGTTFHIRLPAKPAP